MTSLLATNSKSYLCLFHLITAGLLDDNLGLDEQDIIEICFLIIDIQEKKVCAYRFWQLEKLFLFFFVRL